MTAVLKKPLVGPVVGTTTQQSIRVWLKGVHGETGVVVYSTDKKLAHATIKTFALDPSLDDTATVELTSLLPDTLYYYVIGSLALAAPDAELALSDLDLSNFKKHRQHQCVRTQAANALTTSFVFGSCRHRGFWNPNRGDRCFRSMTELHKKNALPTDFILMAGDQVYADVLHYENVKPSDDDALEYDFLGQRHYYLAGRSKSSQEQFYQLYRDAWNKKGFRKLLSYTPAYMMMDDHEVINDWSPVDFNEQGSDGKHKSEVLNWGLTAYQAYQAALAPIRSNDADAPVDRRYHYQFEHGDCEFFVLDIRSKRRGNTEHERQQGLHQPPTQLGREQLDELFSFIARTSTKMKFIVSAVPIFPDVNKFEAAVLQRDTWSGFQAQRLQILDAIYESRQSNIAFLSGDVHCSFIAQLTSEQDPDFKLYNIVSSAFNWVFPGLNRGHFLEDRPLAAMDLESPRSGDQPVYESSIVDLNSRLLTGDVIVVNNFCHLQVDTVLDDHGLPFKRLSVNYYTEKGKSLAKKDAQGRRSAVKTLEIRPR